MADDDVDLSFLDRPEILGVIFYPRKSIYVKRSRPDAKNYFVEVENGVRIGCRFYLRGPDCASMLYFHGNGEIVDDYDWCAHLFNDIGINLFVADYRGYGFSNGEPTITNMVTDSPKIFKRFKEIVTESNFDDTLFVMGRSLGSIPAIEVVFHYQEDVKGLIIESGSATNFLYFFEGLIPRNHPIWDDKNKLLNRAKVRSISKPTLIIHAEYDSLVPLEEGEELYNSSSAKHKRFLMIPNANHNDLMVAGEKAYFEALKEFVETHK